MRIRAYVYAALALVACFPAAAFAGGVVATQPTIPPDVVCNPLPPSGDGACSGVIAGSTVSVTCRAEGWKEGMGGFGTIDVALSTQLVVSGGTVEPAIVNGPGTNTTDCPLVGGTCNLLVGTFSWTTPSEPGTHTARCRATFQQAGPTETPDPINTWTTYASDILPPAADPVQGPDSVMSGLTYAYSVTAEDRNDPPRPLTYAWSASGGTVSPTSNPAAVNWAVPEPGGHTLTVSISNGIFRTVVTKSVSVQVAEYQDLVSTSFLSPSRLALTGDGGVVVVDRQPDAYGELAFLTARGEFRGRVAVPEPVAGVAEGAGVLWVTTRRGGLFKLDPVTGRNLGEVPISTGRMNYPGSVAYDPTSMNLWIGDSGSKAIRILKPDGTAVALIRRAGTEYLSGISDVAVDPAANRAWVLLANPSGEPGTFVKAFDLSGQYVGSYVPFGIELGQLARGGGLAVAPNGRVYASDANDGKVQVFSPALAPLATLGHFGSGEGELQNPGDMVVMANGDLAVLNTGNGRIDRFGTGVPLPTCDGDADCDGLPDAWEVAAGLNPGWAGDGLLDSDGDGLNNADEHARGTNPANRDTDGDGYSDGDEVASGFDPTNPNDHGAIVSVSGPGETDPGLVRLSATANGPGTCAVQWTQAAGDPATVTLSDPAAPSPTFVARAAGTYRFDAVATCGALQSLPGRVAVVVRNVPPRAQVPAMIVAAPGAPIPIDALASSDANDDPLAFSWDQTVGSPITGPRDEASFTVRPRGIGIYAFRVAVSDGEGEGAAEVPVLVTAGEAPTAIAGAVPATPEVGAAVLLDASASVAEGPATFSWQQVAGSLGQLSGADQAVATFTPAVAGRYAFAVTVTRGALRSPPARVDVWVSETGAALPVVTASADQSSAIVNQPVALAATATGGATEFAWRQVSGPAAGLTDADSADATVVPFARGYYVFEATARNGAAESRPARVAFEAVAAGGGAIPRAVAGAPQPRPIVGELTFLDGRASTGAVRHRWTQVAGPWVALPQQALTWFRPHADGLYAFELVVDDGTTRSAPVRIEINVVSPEGVQ